MSAKPPDEADRLKAGTLNPNPMADAERAKLRVVAPNERATNTADPSDLPAERALLGALLWAGANQPDMLRVTAVQDLLEDSQPFYDRGHGHVFDAMRDCAFHKAEHDPIAVYASLVKMGCDRALGGLDGLRSLMNEASTVSERQARIYATAIRVAWARRAFILDLRVLAEDARSPKANLAHLVERAQTTIEQTAKKSSVGATSISLKDSIRVFVKKLETPGNDAISTGFRDMDVAANGGLRAPEVSVIAADTSVGKSLLAAKIAENMVGPEGKIGGLYVTLEMPHDSFTARLVSARSGVPLSLIRRKLLTQTHWQAITQAVAELHQKGLYFADDPSQTLAAVYAAGLERKRMLAQEGKRLGIVVIDHAGLIKPSAEMLKKANREQQVAETSRGLRFIAQRLDCHVMALVQINRDAQGKGNEGVPKLRHLAESYALARDPDLIWILHRNRDPKTGLLDKVKPAALVLAKGRMDETAVMLLGYRGAGFCDYNGSETFSEVYG